MVKKIFTILQLIILFGFVSGLHDESWRLQILSMIIHTMVMRKNDKLATDVYLTELSTLTKNFSGAEIEGLVRSTQATAMNRLIKVSKSAYLTELAILTKNFSGAEIEGLVRCAQATAMNQLIKVRRSDFTLCSHICISICCNDGSELTVHYISSDFHSLEILNTIFICI